MNNLNSVNIQIQSLLGKTDDQVKSIVDLETDISVLTDYMNQCSNMSRYEIAAFIRDKINELHKNDNQSENKESEQEYLDNHKTEMNDLKEKEEETKKALLSDLVQKLNDDGIPISGVDFSTDYQNAFDTFLLSIKNDLSLIRRTYDFVFDNYKGNLNKMKAELQKLRQMELNLSNKLQAELPKYNQAEIQTLPLYTYRLIPKKVKIMTEDGMKSAWLAPEKLKFKNKLRMRYRLNKTVKMFNNFGDDSEKAMKYFLAKTTFLKGGNLSAGAKTLIDNVGDFLTGRTKSLENFDKKYIEIKKQFVDDLIGDQEDFDPNEKKVILSLQKRLDYYYARYKRTHYGI